ncbi:MAG: alpha-E domain-containing protein [Cyclobacteriaceae bacterium]
MDFRKHMLNFINIIKGLADNTLLRHKTWSMTRAGIYLERTIQITQILITRLEEVSKIEMAKLSPVVTGYHQSLLLRSAGGFDMSRHYYQEAPNRERGIKFLF